MMVLQVQVPMYSAISFRQNVQDLLFNLYALTQHKVIGN